jgi:trehalose 6-phosphate phosphatase
VNHQAEGLLAAFWPRLQRHPAPVLLLDYDGTLAPFRVARDEAFPYPGVRQRLAALLGHSGTRLVIVSGRTVADLLPLLGMEPHPEIWGCHGWERLLPSGEYRLGDLPAAARSALDEAAAWIAGRGLEAHSESKPASVTLHWRGLDEQSAAGLRRSATAAWRPLAEEAGLELHAFDGGLELRHPGRDKGSAVREVLAETSAAAAIAYLGDDLTDEDAFRALHGRGLSILVRSRRRASAADLWLRPPEELLAFLDNWLQQATEGMNHESTG